MANINIADIRKKFPQYDDLSDDQLMGALHKKYYSDMSALEFKAKISKPEKQESLQDKVLRYGAKGPAAGTAKLARNVADVPPAVLNWIADLPPTLGNRISEALGSNFRMPYAGKKAEGGPAFPYSGITDEEIYKATGLPPAEEQNYGDMASQLVPDLAGALLVPEVQLPKWGAQLLSKAPGLLGKILPKTASQAGTQALYGGAVSPEGHKQEGALMSGLLTATFAGLGKAAQVTPSVPLRHALGLTGATGAGLLGYEAGESMGLPASASAGLGALLGAGTYRGLASPKAKMAAQVEGVDLTDPAVIERLEAADRLGVNITPGEATKSPFLGGEHAQLGRSKEGSKKYYETAEQRIEQEKAAIKKLLETTYEPTTMDPKVISGYEKLYPQEVPPTLGLKYSNNKTLQKAVKNIEKDSELMAQAEKAGITSGEGEKLRLDKTKLGFWDLMKRYLDKEVGRVSSPDAPSVDKLKKETFDELRKDIIKDLDPLFPQYKEIRSLSERAHARGTIEKAFDKAGMSGKQFFKAFESDEKFNELMSHLRDVPEAQKMMKDMRLIFEESRKKPSITATAGLKGTGLDQDRNLFTAGKEFIKKIVGDSKHDAEAIEFITSGKWQKRMDEINKISDSQKKVAKFIELLGDASAPIGREATKRD
jgi:hypothetical protein